VEDACERARKTGADRLEVTVGPAPAFHEKLGFDVVGTVQTRFRFESSGLREQQGLPHALRAS
jgi:hypothetical protein